MAKSLTDERYETRRGYNCSQNIKKFTQAGSNAIDGYSDMIIPTENIANIETASYDVPYLGTCSFTKIIQINHAK